MYHAFSIAHNPAFMSFIDMGVGFASEKLHYGPAHRAEYFIHYVIKGRGYFNGNTVSAGQGFLIHDIFASYHYDEADPWEYIWIASKDERMDEVFKLYNADKTGIFDYHSVSYLKSLLPIFEQNHQKCLSASTGLEIFLKILNSHTATETTMKKRGLFPAC